MLIELKDLTPIKKEVEVEIPAEAIRTELDTLTVEFGRQAKVPGFRPGKVPARVVRTKFDKKIKSEALDRLLPRFFFQAVGEKGLEPVGNPSVKHVDALTDEPVAVRFVAEFEVKPHIDLQNYRGLEVVQPALDISPAELDSVLDRLRDQASSFEPVTGRVAQEGDYLVIDIDSSGEGVEPRKSENYQFQLGADAPLTELNEQLFGRSVGDQVAFDKIYDENAPNEMVRGKTVHYDIVVKEVRTRIRPELNDEFARSTGIGETADELRTKVGEDLKRHKEQEAQQGRRQQIGDHLLRLHQIEAPDVLLEEELGNSLRNYARYLASQGVDLEYAKVDWGKIRDEFKPEAEKRVKRGLILEAVARAEKLEVSDVEVDAEIRKAVSGANREFAEVKHRLRHDGGYDSLRASLLQEKALEFLLTEAKVTGA